MANFDLQKNISEFTEKICRGITSGKVRREIAQEYADHIEDEVYNLTLGGMSEEEAFHIACENLGDTKVIGELLSEVHNDERIKLPSDIKGCICKRILAEIGPIILITLPHIVFGVILYFANIPTVILVSYLFFITAYNLLVRTRYFEELINLIKDGTVMGTVVSVTPIAAYESGNSFSFRRRGYGLYITVKVFDKGERSFRVYPLKPSDKSDVAGFYNKFKVGMKVLHVFGTDYVQILSDEYGNAVNPNCVVCGEENRSENKTCENCGHTLHIL